MRASRNRPQGRLSHALAATAFAAACVLEAVAPNDSASLAVSGAATSPCLSPECGFCATCDACCADLSVAACTACVADNCETKRCDPGSAGGCNVCDACCKSYLSDPRDCDACTNAACAGGPGEGTQCTSHGTKSRPVTCDLDCATDCTWPLWELSEKPCLRHCGWPLFFLAIAAMLLRLLDHAWEYGIQVVQLDLENRQSRGRRFICFAKREVLALLFLDAKSCIHILCCTAANSGRWADPSGRRYPRRVGRQVPTS